MHAIQVFLPNHTRWIVVDVPGLVLARRKELVDLCLLPQEVSRQLFVHVFANTQ